LNILIDIGHPAHVHLFKSLYTRLKISGHQVFITTKNINSVIVLLKQFKVEFINLGDKPERFVNKVAKQLYFTWKIIQIVRQKQIDICIGVSLSIPMYSCTHPSVVQRYYQPIH